jgi:hypothetical protein
MNREMTIEEIESQFESEWVLIEDPRTDEGLKVLGVRSFITAKTGTRFIARRCYCVRGDPLSFTPGRSPKKRRLSCELLVQFRTRPRCCPSRGVWPLRGHRFASGVGHGGNRDHDQCRAADSRRI